MGEAFSPVRSGDGCGKRLRPGGEGADQEALERAVCLALAETAAAACRLAGDMAWRAERLVAAAPKLRAKGAGEVVKRLRDDDAVSGTLTAEKPVAVCRTAPVRTAANL